MYDDSSCLARPDTVWTPYLSGGTEIEEHELPLGHHHDQVLAQRDLLHREGLLRVRPLVGPACMLVRRQRIPAGRHRPDIQDGVVRPLEAGGFNYYLGERARARDRGGVTERKRKKERERESQRARERAREREE